MNIKKSIRTLKRFYEEHKEDLEIKSIVNNQDSSLILTYNECEYSLTDLSRASVYAADELDFEGDVAMAMDGETHSAEIFIVRRK